ncbi:uncharacterized protein LOC132757376 isoform X2 [Ruditapes philippinarum]|uniref:uncharacterized protein LOC132757376 isoform X2 n=1 Tax=Ruditapes philippinarum TaxID=129788 RepID=UPI00295AD527|nr:uncharacterized protein LOC132757376 isoform X2 [Ruditapes philippinarum]
MTSNDETKEFKEESQSFALNKVGKYWILKTKTSSKRLAFLDDAKYVRIDDNILIADERLFEIHKNEKGEYLFRHLEDVACEIYFTVTESSAKTFWKKIDPPEPIKTNKENSEMDVYDYAENEQVPIQYEEPSARPVKDDNYEEINFDEGKPGHSKLVNDSLSMDDKKMQHLNIQTTSSADTKSCNDDLNIGSVDELNNGPDDDLDSGSAAEMMEGQEKYNPLEVGSTEEDSAIFYVDLRDLTKICAMEGEMTLSIKDTAFIFKDINTGKEKYRFPFPWIRRFWKDDSSFGFEAGRKCPNGAGNVICTTPEANQIHDKCVKVMEDNKQVRNQVRNENIITKMFRRLTSRF